MNDMAWEYLYSTEGEGATYRCTTCGHKIITKFNEKKFQPCSKCGNGKTTCLTCKWFKLTSNADGGRGDCCRYPEWLYISPAYRHYCGEWKDKSDDEQRRKVNR